MLRCSVCEKIKFMKDKNNMCSHCVQHILSSTKTHINNIKNNISESEHKYSHSLYTRQEYINKAKNEFDNIMNDTYGLVYETYYQDEIKLIRNKIHNIKQDIENKITINNNIQLSYNDVINRYLTEYIKYVPDPYDNIMYPVKEFECMLENIPRHNIVISNTPNMNIQHFKFDFKNKNITIRTHLENFKDFVAINVATTGLDTNNNRIIEISAIKFNNFRPISMFETLINPQMNIPQSATNINHITNKMVKDAPTFDQIKDDLFNFIDYYPIVAHNAEFDTKFLYAEGMNLDFNKIIVYDTLFLSKNNIKGLYDYKLQTVCNNCGIKFKDAYRSSAHALSVGLLIIEILKIKFSTTNILTLLKKNTQQY